MFNIIGVVIVSPFWGLISTQLFLQAWLAVINFFVYLVGFFKGRVVRKDNLLGMGVALFHVVLFSILLRLGFFLLGDVLLFGYTTAENVVYWIFAGLSLLYMLPQIPSKLKTSWRNATKPGYLEAGIIQRKVTKWRVMRSKEGIKKYIE